MRSVFLRPLLAVLLALLAQLAAAQNRPSNLQPLPEQPPPPPGMVEDSALEPQVTIRKRGEDKVEEYRVNGKLYMLKVTPPHGTPYYLVDQRGDGGFVRQEMMGSDKQLAVPMWVIRSF